MSELVEIETNWNSFFLESKHSVKANIKNKNKNCRYLCFFYETSESDTNKLHVEYNMYHNERVLFF